MRQFANKLALCMFGTLALAACAKTTPKAEEPKPDPAWEVSEPKTPPPPKCVSLADMCVANAETKVPVGSRASFQPPQDWTYARLPTAAVTVPSEADAAVAFAEAEGTEADQVIAALQPIFETLEIANVDADAIRKQMKRAPVVMNADELALKTWELSSPRAKDAPTMGGEPGKLLIVVSSPDSGAVAGTVFVQNKAPEQRLGSAAQAIQTLRGAP